MIQVLVDTARNAPKVTDRLAAVRELLDRGYGKAPAFAAIEGLDPLELDAVSHEIQVIADELARRREERQSVPPARDPGIASG